MSRILKGEKVPWLFREVRAGGYTLGRMRRSEHPARAAPELGMCQRSKVPASPQQKAYSIQAAPGDSPDRQALGKSSSPQHTQDNFARSAFKTRISAQEDKCAFKLSLV